MKSIAQILCHFCVHFTRVRDLDFQERNEGSRAHNKNTQLKVQTMIYSLELNFQSYFFSNELKLFYDFYDSRGPIYELSDVDVLQ